ncbi:MAG: imidazole glycerol phosphate synthase subunit HisF [Planctomycetota bacterium]
MLKVRLIPCLDVDGDRVVKGVKFQDLRDSGDPVERARTYLEAGADELVLLDVSATLEARENALATVARVRSVLSIPLTVGGGVRSVRDASRLLEAGADKVAVNTAAVENPDLLNQLAARFGSQCVVLSVDAARRDAGRFEVCTRSGSRETDREVADWCREAVARGAGEILVTSIDRDGTRSGYDLELLRLVSDAVQVPVIASGGASSSRDLVDGVRSGASAVLAASILHDGDATIASLKGDLASAGVEVRR